MSQTVTVVVTDPSTGAHGSASVTLTGGSTTGGGGTTPPPSGSPSPPSQAAAAGFTHAVFNSDFTATSDVASTEMQASGADWYFAQRSGRPASATEWTVNPTATAASIKNGNSGGGSNASSAGGILTIHTGKFPNENLISVPGWAMNNSAAKMPAFGHWGHGYYEAYIQFVPNANPALPFQQTGWIAFFGWNVESIGDYGFGSCPFKAANPTEVDFLEQFGHAEWSNGGQDPPGYWGATLINHGSGWTRGYASGTLTDSNWHTYGMLWVPGTISTWFDNKQIGSVATSSTSIENGQTLFLTLGTGPNWPMNVDWVRVWQ